MLADLLPLEDEAPMDSATREKLGRLFLAAGSPARAVEIYREVLRNDPRRADARAGLGEAEFAGGNYRAARDAFEAVIRLRPNDENARARVDVCDRILELDPTLRGLGPEEQHNRSRKLLDLALREVRQCAGAAVPAEGVSKRHRSYLENIALAGKLLQIRNTNCQRAAAQGEDPLENVLTRLAQK